MLFQEKVMYSKIKHLLLNISQKKAVSYKNIKYNRNSQTLAKHFKKLALNS